MQQENSQKKLAVLIDADNTQPAIIDALLAEIAKYGIASVRRIYGDWTTPNLRGWKDVLLEQAIQPIQQFRYTVGKNATDSALIIDAMDLLYTEKLDGFCIVSSDSDFTRLASRIREAGLIVYGFGEKKTPKAFLGACDKFVYTEILREDEPTGPRGKKNTSDLNQDTTLVNLLRNAVEYSVGLDECLREFQLVIQPVDFNREMQRQSHFYHPAGDPSLWGGVSDEITDPLVLKILG